VGTDIQAWLNFNMDDALYGLSRCGQSFAEPLKQALRGVSHLQIKVHRVTIDLEVFDALAADKIFAGMGVNDVFECVKNALFSCCHEKFPSNFD
jgi:hypothetical protein